MLRFQIALAIIFVGCIAFLSCGRSQEMLDPVTEVTPTDMLNDMLAAGAIASWESVMHPAPVDTGVAHGTGSRTVYFNEAGAMANKAGTMYPAGTMIVKKAMDATNTFVKQVVAMIKTDDPRYEAHNGWIYSATQRDSETDELMPLHQLTVEMSMGCHGCHAKASNDSVFVSLIKDQMVDDTTMMDDTTMDDTTMDDTMMDDTMMDDTTMDDTMMDDTTMDDTTMDDTTMDDGMADDGMTDDGNGNGANGNGAGNGNGNGANGNGATQ